MQDSSEQISRGILFKAVLSVIGLFLNSCIGGVLA